MEETPKEIYSDKKIRNGCQRAPLPLMKITSPFPQRMKKKDVNYKFKIFMEKLRNLSINIPLLEALQEILCYNKSMKNLMLKKTLMEGETIEVTHYFSAIITYALAEKKVDLGAFTIPCTIQM